MTKKRKNLFAWICFAAMLIGMNGYAAEPEQPKEDQNTDQVKLVILPDEEKDAAALEIGDAFAMKLLLENVFEADISPTIVVTSTSEENAVKIVELEANEHLKAVRKLETALEADVTLLKAHEKLELQMKAVVPEELAGKSIAVNVTAKGTDDAVYGAANLELKVKAVEEEKPEVPEKPEQPEEPEDLEPPEQPEEPEKPEQPEEPEQPEVLELDVKVEALNDLSAIKRGETFKMVFTITNPNKTDLMNVFVSADIAKDEDGNETLGIGSMTISDKLKIKDHSFEVGEIKSGEQVIVTYEAIIPKDVKETNLYFIYHVSSWDFENNEPFAQKGGLELLTLAEDTPDTSEEDKKKEELKKQEEELKKQQEEAKKQEEELKKQQEEAKKKEEELKKKEEELKKKEAEAKKKKDEEAKKKAAEEKKKAAPKTGDHTNISVIVLCMLLAAAVVVVSVRKRILK